MTFDEHLMLQNPSATDMSRNTYHIRLVRSRDRWRCAEVHSNLNSAEAAAIEFTRTLVWSRFRLFGVLLRHQC